MICYKEFHCPEDILYYVHVIGSTEVSVTDSIYELCVRISRLYYKVSTEYGSSLQQDLISDSK